MPPVITCRLPAIAKSATGRLLCAAALAIPLATPSVATAEVFINELHYDNAGSDRGERVEVVATAGENLSDYRIYLYNGSEASAARVYDSTWLDAGQSRSCGGSVRVATVSYPSNGLQNGAPDALALVNGDGYAVQFLSYEGEVTAAEGPARYRRSVALPVSENSSTAAGDSLQLAGSGERYGDFAWQTASAQTFGDCNHGQTFAGANPAPQVVATEPADGSSDFPAAGDLGVSFSEAVTLADGAIALQCDDSGAVDVFHAGTGEQFTITTGEVLHAGESCTLTVFASLVTDAGGVHPTDNTDVSFQVAAGSDDGYYAHVNAGSPAQLRCTLHQTIRGHTAYPYSGSGTSTWTILEIADQDPADPGRILDVYRNRSYARGADRAGTGSGVTYNREHTWPNSLGFGSRTGDRGLPNAPYTDTHMLYLSDTGYNGDRGNKPYADCPAPGQCGERPTEPNGGEGGGSGSYPGNSNWVYSGGFETWHHRRGDVARAVMYMAIRYEGGRDATTGQSEPDLELTDDRSLIEPTSSSPAYMGLLSTLLDWHQADPPDAGERARNEVVFSYQGNRNPFIDHPEWASAALFNSQSPPVCQPL